MKTRTRASMLGAGAGLALFAVVGLLPGSFLGGVMGLSIAGTLFGYPVAAGIVPRLIVAASMLLGVMVSGAMFVLLGGGAGWLLGRVAETASAGAPGQEKIRV